MAPTASEAHFGQYLCSPLSTVYGLAPERETGGTAYSMKKSAKGDAKAVMLGLSGTMLRHIPAGGTDAPGGRAAAGNRTAGGRDRGTGGLRKSKQIRSGLCQAVRLPAAGVSQKGTARSSRALFCPVSESVIPPRRSAATGRSRSGAPPCGGRDRPAPSAPPGCPAGPHGRPPAPRCGPPPPRCASGGR